MKKLVLVLLAIVSVEAMAQGLADMVRYSQQTYQVTAKSMAMGGSIGAVGADLSSATVNPAGLGLYHRGDITYTMGHLGVRSLYNDFNSNDRSGVNNGTTLNSFGAVFWTDDGQDERIQFALTYNRTASFCHSYVGSAVSNTSVIDNMVQGLGGVMPDDMNYSQLAAWNTYLINTIGGDYASALNGLANNQSFKENAFGRMSEVCFSTSCSFRDRHYFGFTFGIPIIRYSFDNKYVETVPDESNALESWERHESVNDYGAGINCKLGYIYYPVSWLRVGLAWHSKSLVEIESSWCYTVKSYWRTMATKSSRSSSDYTYAFFSPGRYLANAAVLFGHRGMITLDYELVNYPHARLAGVYYYYDEWNEEHTEYDRDEYMVENDRARNELRAASNFKIGTEWCLGNFRLRGGVAYYQNPYRNGENSRMFSFSCGAGINLRALAFDIAYVNYISNSYNPLFGGTPCYELVSVSNQLVATLHFKL